MTDVARTRRELDRDGALAWARALWREPVHERRTAAIEVLRWYTRRLLPADLALVEAWVREAHGWAYVDPLAGDIAGPIALVHPDAWPLIDAWATDEDFWVRGSALLTLLPGIRRGGLDHERFERYATPMLTEKEFFICKAVGWALREAARRIWPTWPPGRAVTGSDVRGDVPGGRPPGCPLSRRCPRCKPHNRRRQGHASA